MKSGWHLAAALVAAFLFAGNADGAAGDGVEGVEVGLRKRPGCPFPGPADGGCLVIQSAQPTPFDEVTITGPRGLAESLSPDKLPPGWTLARKGRKAILSGPALGRPVRMILTVAGGDPREASFEVSHQGVVLQRVSDQVLAEIVPAPSNSLAGVVSLPKQVRPSELVAFQSAATLPPGTFRIGGNVVSKIPEDETREAFRNIPAARARIAERLIEIPAAGITLTPPDGVPCADLAPVAAMLTLSESGPRGGELPGGLGPNRPGRPTRPVGPLPPRAITRQEWGGEEDGSFFVWRVARRDGPAGTATTLVGVKSLPADALDGATLAALAAIGAGRGVFGVSSSAPAAGPGGEKPPGTGGGQEGQQAAADSTGTKKKHRFVLLPMQPVVMKPVDETDPWPVFKPVAKPVDEPPIKPWPPTGTGPTYPIPDEDPPLLEFAPLEVRQQGSDCRFLPRDPATLSDYEVLTADRGPQPPEGSAGRGTEGRPMYLLEIGTGLAVGGALLVEYTDIFGDSVIHARTPVEVLPERSPTEEPPAPCVRSSTPYVTAGGTVCVCGDFPSPAAWAGLLVNERPVASFLTASSTGVWFQLPEGSPPGHYLVSGDPAAGYDRSCRAQTDLVEVRAEIDSSQLTPGQTTPMHFTVIGSELRLPIEARNLTPGIVDFGGPTVTVETAGGAANTATLEVRALVRGAFNAEWTVRTPPCPCGGGG